MWMSSFVSPKFNFELKDFDRRDRDGRLRDGPRCSELLAGLELSNPFSESFDLHMFQIKQCVLAVLAISSTPIMLCTPSACYLDDPSKSMSN